MNLTALNNITPIEFNNSIINDSTEIVPNMISNANTITDGYFGLGIMFALFIFLLLITMAEQDVFRLRFSTALVFSSAMALLVGILMIVSNITGNFYHVMWFAMIFMISLLMKFYEQN